MCCRYTDARGLNRGFQILLGVTQDRAASADHARSGVYCRISPRAEALTKLCGVGGGPMYRETFQVRCRKALPRFLPVASKLILAPSLLIAACVCTDGFGVLRAQTLTIVPSHVMPDESAVIRAS